MTRRAGRGIRSSPVGLLTAAFSLLSGHKGVPSVAIRHVEPYSDEWRHQPRRYVSRVVDALGAEALEWWEGPYEPREVVIRLADGAGLVWDEESGWRLGGFVSGEPGARTELTRVRYLGGGL